VFSAPRLRDFLPRYHVVLIDDGLATGHTLLGAIAHLRRLGAKHITVAVPCAARSSAARVRKASDAFLCPVIDDDFMAVGSYYRDFAQVEDAQVQQVLEHAATRVTP
jgi:predicted phosphoribosyltransferase